MSSIQLNPPQYNYLLKVVIAGEAEVGKSAILRRYTDNIFETNYSRTIGVQFGIKTVSVREDVVKFQIWDTAGLDRFRNIVRSYYRGAHCHILVFDITNEESFLRLSQTLNEVRQANPSPIILVGNKLDRESERVVAKEVAQEFAEISVKQNINIDELFIRAGEKSIDANLLVPHAPIRVNSRPQRRYNNYQDSLNDQSENKQEKKGIVRTITPIALLALLLMASLLVSS